MLFSSRHLYNKIVHITWQTQQNTVPRALHANWVMADCRRSGLVACTTSSCWNAESFLQTNGGNSCSHWLLRE